MSCTLRQNFNCTLVALALASGHCAFAKPVEDNQKPSSFSREISLEWEPLADAKTYDVQIESLESATEPESHHTKESEWKGRLALGHYTLKVRGRDRRKVPGNWSPPVEFTVNIENAKIETPRVDQRLNSQDPNNFIFDTKWKKIPGAIGYEIELVDQDGKVLQREKTEQTSISVTAPVAKELRLRVHGLGPGGYNSQDWAESHFSVVGPALEKFEIQRPGNAYVREISWQTPPQAEQYDYSLLRQDSRSGKWLPVDKKNGLTTNRLNFPSSYPGGNYRISVRAKANLRQSSPVAEMIFDVAKGSRSPAAEELGLIRDSIDPVTGWFGIASYLITSISYQGVNSDRTPNQPLNVNLGSAIGGTGRVGAGYLSHESRWGFLGVGDYSGISVNSSLINYASLEGNAIYRFFPNTRGEIRQHMGLFYKQFPILQANLTSNIIGGTAAAIGPHYGIEYWYGLNRTIGLQANLHGYINLLTAGTPSGGGVTPSISYQAGFLGSYRFTRRMTGLAGYAFRTDSISYTASDGNTNSSSVIGNYLNLFLEWAL